MPIEPAPDVLALIDAIRAHFPDLGGAVTDAAEARRILAAAPEWPFGPPTVGSVEDRAIAGPTGAPDIPLRIYRPTSDLHRPTSDLHRPMSDLHRPMSDLHPPMSDLHPPMSDPNPGTEPTPEPTRSPLPRPTVVFFHGGGWVIGGLDTHDPIARALCRDAGAVVVSVDYRLAPEARFPAAVDDAYAAVCWAAEHVGELGGDPGALVVAGDSAGGNLAAVAALIARDRGGPALALQVLVYPATDVRPRQRGGAPHQDASGGSASGGGPSGGSASGGSASGGGPSGTSASGGGSSGSGASGTGPSGSGPSGSGASGTGTSGTGTSGREGAGYFLTAAHGRWFAEQYFGTDGDRAHPYASPLLADLQGLPPAHIVTAGFDLLSEEGRAYAVKLSKSGISVTEGHYPAMFHGFFGFPELLADARAAQRRVAEVIASTVPGRKKSGGSGGRAG
ncbi:alpha/beta hydrolase [Streptomyces sp. NPDC048309]|uniref:alpha/beta hydrolase n=1 Tax=Streptomyces sp. NPDC048309 TaxID=3154618 RepID=UPI0033CAB49B